MTMFVAALGDKNRQITSARLPQVGKGMLCRIEVNKDIQHFLEAKWTASAVRRPQTIKMQKLQKRAPGVMQLVFGDKWVHIFCECSACLNVVQLKLWVLGLEDPVFAAPNQVAALA